MNLDIFCESFNKKLNKLNIKLSEEQYRQFYDYMNLLIEWNEKINLTAIVEPEDIILKHFIDSLTVSKYVENGQKIADIGTGAGFPGIPLKIANPENEVVLIDSLNKRIKFLDEVIAVSKLDKIEAVHARAEEIGHNKNYREQFEIVTSRAVARLNTLLEYMMPLLKVGGKCVCLKGPNITDEVEDAKNAIEVLGGKLETIEEITLPDSDNKRTIIIVKKVKPTSNTYPRKPGTPSSSPI